MKKFLFVVVIAWVLSGCSIFRKQEKYDCPTNGKNIGAERILSGDKDAIKAAKKAGKFKGPESY
ncbi:MAG TPA: lipoprotein [Hanamia sp.]